MVLESPSYLEMQFHANGKDPLMLKIPTFWDATKQQWIAAIHTPISKTLIHAEGKDSFDLQNAFNIELRKILEKRDDLTKEVFEMFKNEK